jgi:Rha family phage regulatory protein
MKQPEVYIEIKQGIAFTNSIDVAEKFGKRHKNVLNAVRQIISVNVGSKVERKIAPYKRVGLNFKPYEGDCSEFGLLNFKESSYLGENNRRQPMYKMTRSGFAILAMGFTGKKALDWKIKYEQAFSAMETALLNQQNLSWQSQRSQGKLGRRTETDTIRDFVAYAQNQGSSKAEFYYTNLTKATYKALFLVKDRFPGPFRDMLDTMQLSYLAAAEYVAANALRDGMANGIHYKDIYKLAKGKLENYALAVGVTPVIAHTTQQQLAA